MTNSTQNPSAYLNVSFILSLLGLDKNKRNRAEKSNGLTINVLELMFISSNIGKLQTNYQKLWFPPGLEIRENLEKWKGIFQSENFVKTGKVRKFYSKYWENQKKLYWKIEKNTGKVREICQPVIVKTLQIWYHTLNKK